MNSTAYYPGPRPRFDMTNDFNLWKGQIRWALVRLGAIPFQSSAGRLATENLGVEFRDLMCELYGACHFTQFIASQAWRQAGLDNHAEEALRALRTQLDEFDEPDLDDELGVDPSWQAILKQTKTVIRLLAE